MKIKVFNTSSPVPENLYKYVCDAVAEMSKNKITNMREDEGGLLFSDPFINSHILYATEESNEIIGFFAFILFGDNCYINIAYVSQSERNSGVFKKLLEYTMSEKFEESVGCAVNEVSFGVFKHNELMCEVMKKSNAVVTDTIPNELGEAFVFSCYNNKEGENLNEWQCCK